MTLRSTGENVTLVKRKKKKKTLTKDKETVTPTTTQVIFVKGPTVPKVKYLCCMKEMKHFTVSNGQDTMQRTTHRVIEWERTTQH